MSRLTTIIVASLVSVLATAGLASAEEEHMQLRCSAAPGDARDLDCVATREVKRDVADRTHSSIFATGNLLRKGEVQYQVHELGVFNRASIGLTDNVEVSVSAPLLPLFGGVGIRVGLLQRESPYRLVVGAGMWAPMVSEDSDERLLQTNATFAYQNENLNVHASLGAFKPVGHDDALLTYSAGFVYKAGTKYALIGEALRLTMAGATAATDSCADYEGDCGGGSGGEHLDGALVGVKLMGEHFDTDLGLFMPFGESDIIGLPVVSMTYRY